MTETAEATAETTETGQEVTTETTTDAKAQEFKVPDGYATKDGKPDLAKIFETFSTYEAEKAARPVAPESPDKYEIKIPEDLKMPDGKPAEIDLESETFVKFREIAHKAGIPQDTFQQFVDLAIERDMGILGSIKEQHDAALAEEIKKLGPRAEARFTNTENWFKAKFGDEGAAFAQSLGTASQIEFIEKLIAKMGGAGLAGASKEAIATSTEEERLARMYPSMAKK